LGATFLAQPVTDGIGNYIRPKLFLHSKKVPHMTSNDGMPGIKRRLFQSQEYRAFTKKNMLTLTLITGIA